MESSTHFLITLLILVIVPVVYPDVCDNKECRFEENKLQCIWTRCPQMKNTTKVSSEECASYGCCYTEDNTFVQEKNISVNCLKTVNRNEKRKNNPGICELYENPPEFCNNSSPNSTRFFDKRYHINGTTRILREFYSTLKSTQKGRCRDIILEAFCPFAVPHCTTSFNETIMAQQPCKEDCDYLFNECEPELQRFLGYVGWRVLKVDSKIDFSHLEMPYSCDLFTYSYDLPVNSTCTKIYEKAIRIPNVVKDESIVGVTVGVVVAVVLLITICVSVVYITKVRRNKKATSLRSTTAELSHMSMREALRVDTIASNPLMELLQSSKPGELVQYPLDCVEYIKELGEGQFGKVFQGRVHGIVKGEESTDVAVKCLKEGSSPVAKATFNQEVALMSVLQHDNILRLLAVSTEEEPYCMIFEFMENGDLNEFLRRWHGKDYLSDSHLIKICKHIASGMEYLASKKFLHRDLATRNCLVGQNLMVKIADFGMSRNVYHSDYYRVGGEAMLPIRWMPPESILYGKFTVASDVYSFGVVMWEVFSFALQPFYGYSNEEVIEFIKKDVLLPMPEDCPEWIYSIMLACWKRDPDERLPFTKALQLLKGKFDDMDSPVSGEILNSYDNYDKVPTRNQMIPTDYDRITVDQRMSAASIGYDVITPNVANNNKPDDYDQIRKGVSGNTDNIPEYVNVQPEPKKKAATKPPVEMSLQILTPNPKPCDENPHNPPTSPGGLSNNAFDDDETVLLKKTTSFQKLVPNEGKSKSISPRTSKKSKALKHTQNTANSTGKDSKGFVRTSTGGRSIKDVMNNEGDPRYVSSETLRKTSVPESNNISNLDVVPRTLPYESAFRPTSEFMQFHGYGESIQANDPDEAKMIKKIIEDRQ